MFHGNNVHGDGLCESAGLQVGRVSQVVYMAYPIQRINTT